MKVITISDLRADIAKVFDSITDDDEQLIVTRSGHEPMVIMPKSEWDAWETTAYLLRGRNGEILRRSIAELDAGQGVEHDPIEHEVDVA